VKLACVVSRRVWSGVLLAMLVMAVGIAGAPGARAAEDNAPVAVSVTSSQAAEPGGLRGLLSTAVSGDVAESARDLELALKNFRVVRLTAEKPEAVVTVTHRARSESRSTDKEGRVTLTHRYSANASVQVGEDRVPVEGSTTFTQGPGTYRDDAVQFRNLANALAASVVGAISQHIDTLRPGRPQHGFDYEAKYRFMIKGDGLEVTSVAPGSPAERAGLQVKDRIRAINGEKGTDQMKGVASSWWVEPSGTRFALEVERNKKRQNVDLTLLPVAQWGGGAAPVATAASTTSSARPSTRATASASGAASSSANVELKVGMTEAEVVRALGQPQKRVTFGPKTIWTYEGFTVTIVGGKVTDVK